MRVLHIVTAFPRSEGDVITPWLVEMLRGLRARSVEVEVLTSSYRGLGGQALWGIPVHRFRYFLSRWENLTHEEMAVDRLGRSPLYKLLPAFYLIAGSLAVWRLCRRKKYDVVHVHWPLPHALFGRMAARACGAKVVTTYYGAEIRWAKHSRLPFLKGFLAWAAKVSDRVVAISTYTKDEIKSIADVPVEVIPYTIGFSENPKSKIHPSTPPRLPPDFPSTPLGGHARGPRSGATLGGHARGPDSGTTLGARNHKSSEKRKIILTVGRLVERKGIRYLIDAMRLLPESLKAELVVVGGGPLREALEAHARVQGVAKRVRFAGKVSEEELKAYYMNAAVYVQPAIVDSRGDTEMLGVVLLEAMHYGVPVVASAVGGIPDVVRDGETGLLVPQKDPKALAHAVQRLLGDQRLARMIEENAHKQLSGNFKWDNILNNMIKVYDNL